MQSLMTEQNTLKAMNLPKQSLSHMTLPSQRLNQRHNHPWGAQYPDGGAGR